MRILIFTLLLFNTVLLSAQKLAFSRFDAPVIVDGQTIALPFVGGLNAPQFSAADLNQDGILDLVVFDRTGDVFLTFLNEGTPNQSSYVFAPAFACNFPALRDFALLRDFNKDGAADIFCASLAPGSQEMQVFQGYFENKMLKFKPFKFGYPASCAICNADQIFFPDNDQPGFWNNLAVSKADLPDISDIDGDGDLDILTFAASVGGHIWFLKNTSMEQGFGTDSLRFRLADDCWGRFYESGFVACKNELSTSSGICSAGLAGNPAEDRNPLHPGSTVMTYDQDGDGDKEVVLGDISFACFNMMTNGGNATTAWMTQQDTLFPSNSVGVSIINFPAPFYFDANNDGKNDLLAALNAKNIGEDRKGVWFYPNRGSNTNHQFELETRSFLVGDMIDIGSIAHPAFADVNADGLTDLVLGNYGYYNNSGGTNASLYLYLNTGTPQHPSFELKDKNWNNFAEFAPNDYDFAPAFGDMDGDGDTDLLVGSNFGAVFCYYNVAGPGQPMALERSFDLMWLQMDVGQSSTPFIRDMDGDGLSDVLMGEKLGNVNYFRNTGIVGQPKFATTPTVDKLGAVDARLPGETLGYSAPAVINTPDGLLLVTGAEGGHLEAYTGLALNNQPFAQVSATWGNVDEGNRSHPAFADLDGDGLLEMAVGNYRGGIALFKTQLKDCTVTTAVQPSKSPMSLLPISPNPARSWAKISLPTQQPAQWTVRNLLGQIVSSGTSESGVIYCTVNGWAAGTYVVEVWQAGKKMIGKLVVDNK